MNKPEIFLIIFLITILPLSIFSQTYDTKNKEEDTRVQMELNKKEQFYKELREKEKKIDIWADKQSYSNKDGLSTLEGNVEIVFGEAHLYADKVELNKISGFIIAEGNVLIEAGKDVISGSKFEGNIWTGYGTFYDVKGYIDPLYYFEGKKAERFKKDKYRLYSGYFTSCEGKTPPWHFKLSRATIHVDNYVYLFNPVLFIHKVPIAYLPFWAYPIKPERTTGLLIPKWGYNSRDGFYYKQGFFWAIRDNMDLELGADWAAKSGWGYDSLFRYVFSKTCGGTIGYNYRKDYLIAGEQANAAVGGVSWLTSNRLYNDFSERWYGHWLHLQTYPYDIKNIVNINFVSDRKYFDDVVWNIADQRQEVSSDISFTKNWTSYSANLYAKYTEDLGDTEIDNFQAVQMIPALTFDSLSKSVLWI